MAVASRENRDWNWASPEQDPCSRTEGSKRREEKETRKATAGCDGEGWRRRQVFVHGSAVSKSDRAGQQKVLEGLRRIPVQIGWAGQAQGRTSRWLSWGLGQRGATKGLRAHPVAPTVGRGNTAAYRIVTDAISAGTGIQHQHRSVARPLHGRSLGVRTA